MNTIEADRYLALKARVKAECLRRKYSGSVEAYGGVDYDFISQPADGKTILLEHQSKLVEPLRHIRDGDYSIPGAQVQESDLAEMESIVTTLEGIEVTNTNTGGCDGGCTGLCYSGCSSGCRNQCSNCGGSCSSGCGYGCGTSCSDNCSHRCDGCTNACREGCGSGCADTCSGNCSANCSDGCSDGCTSSCMIGCIHTNR